LVLTALVTTVTIAGVAAGGCALSDAAEAIAGNEDLNLTNEETGLLIAAADAGDSEAAFRLYLFYSSVSGDHDAGERWLRRAAGGGHLVAQYNLGVELVRRGGASERAEGRRWLERASKAGYEPARETLERYMPE
jgi:TPR repeat protein